MLKINKLKISSPNKQLVDISFDIKDSSALIGESGSGKSLTLKALLNLLPSSLQVEKDIYSTFELNYDTIGFIPQNPFTSLSMMTKIKDQFFCSNEKKEEVLKLVDLDISLLNKFPSQLSGGQIQRIVIAIALSRNIKLLLLDEPTTALDEENKTNIINLINDLKSRLNILILFVTHDIESIKDICNEIIILKDGQVIEKGFTIDVLSTPKEDYTKKLINSTFKNKQFRN
ncbi:putative dipeptide/oligopeptide/nickel ABC transporter, ATP-binding protein [Arcobacter acticola]|uniref:Putative dipeptide/oligopeptide/nickel ABC transporter, ATP-binding protein n=1 Tax=Arcobacter acticola TaxID=1849015 RepID=A0A6M8EG87_9BACT|nr:ATP-binding cassette domain-containing protein [Arcobacter acticola]QKE29630.1 putative dipeptide/oligopeptide/nickel ABC transporter, ATP-binding protein [Arcobacter acticola]